LQLFFFYFSPQPGFLKFEGLLMVVVLLMFKMKLIRIPSTGMGGLCVGIFSSLQGWLCIGVLCALQYAKIAWGQVGKVMDA
jgi:hypothetical protein